MNISTPLEHSDQEVSNVHSDKLCAGSTCPIHNRSNHFLRKFPQRLATVNGVVVTVRKCEHGFQHLDPDESDTYLNKHYMDRKSIEGSCDGCCTLSFESNEVN